MKTIAIITDGDTHLDEFLTQNLQMVFCDRVIIRNYYSPRLEEGCFIDADVILVMTPERIGEALPYNTKGCHIIPIARTLMEDTVYPIFSIPSGTDVLIVNDAPDTTLQMVECLRKIGIRHINLIPYESSSDTCQIKLAITPGESRCVPPHIEHIIDVGNRYIDVSTFIILMDILDVRDDSIHRNLITYSNQIISLDLGIKHKYRELSIKSEELDEIINMSGEGILVTNEKGDITVCNKSFLRIMNINRNIIMDNISTIFQEGCSHLLKSDELHNEILKIGDRYINVNKKPICHLGTYAGNYFNIQEITYIKKLEMTLNEKLRTTGQQAKYQFEDIMTSSDNMVICKQMAERVSDTDLTILITGESGTGKELLSQSIHNASKRRNQPFIAINCAAMPINLLESELFGYEPGAFTGALKTGKKGLIEQAHHGTVFLDEIGDMPIVLQTKLLRVLQEKQIMRVGSDKLLNVDVRFIVATNKDLYALTRQNKFRVDLYYRINSFQIDIPPLRDRKKDLLPLLEKSIGTKLHLTKEVEELLHLHPWEGNIRELINVAAYISTIGGEKLSKSQLVDLSMLPPYLSRHHKKISPSEISVLKERQVDEEAILILKLLKNSTRSLGRNAIINLLLKQNVHLSQAKVRDTLAVLKDLRLVSSNIGRGGSKITSDGMEFLKRL